MRQLISAFIMVCCSIVVPATSVAQHSSAATPRSTQSGVYTAEQAARGEDTYATLCTGCHTAATHTGTAFQHWDGHSLADLFGYISTRMPKNEPGSLAPEQYVDVMAYLLKLNQMPVGRAELPTDTTVLGTIRIETKAAAASKRGR